MGFRLYAVSKEDVGFSRFQKNRLSRLHRKKLWSGMPNVFVREQQPPTSWRAFLGACKTVAQVHAERASTPIRILDVSTLAPESFLCLVIEIWASEILNLLGTDERSQFCDLYGHVDWRCAAKTGLLDWIQNYDYLLAFYRTWLLLVESLSFPDMVERYTIPRLKAQEVDGAAAATRHWYKTACEHQRCPITDELVLPVHLPGHFSIRGDWFLALAGGSRSERLGRRALAVRV